MLGEVLKKGELYEFFTGQKNYYKANAYEESPMDTDFVFEQFKEYYLKTNDAHIWELFEETLIKVSNSYPYSCMSLYYLYDYLSFRNTKRIEIHDLENLLNSILTPIILQKQSLSGNFNWIGKKFKNGLWGDLVRMSKIINEKFGLGIKVENVG